MANRASVTRFNQYFPYIPAYSTWNDFNGNIILFYSGQPIPHTDEANWKHTANNMAQLPVFSSYPLPNPELFDNWQDWAHQFSLIVNGRQRQ